MKTLHLTIAITSLFAAVNAQQINYTQITTGLNTVTYEIGYTELELADMNNDGNLDIVSIGDHGSPNINATEGGVMVWLNNGNGTSFTLKKTGSLGYGGIAVADINNDGKKDVGIGMHHNYGTTDLGDQLIEVLLGNGTSQSWTPYDDGLATNGETYGMFGVDFADINNDGLLDIGANSFGCCAGIHVYKNNGNGTWTQTDGAVGGNAKHWFKFGDLNRDGNVDCVVASELGAIFKNDGTGYFTSMQNGFPNEWYMEYDLADINHDGAKDIAFVESNNMLYAYTYNTQLQTWQNISTGLPTAPIWQGVSLFDMNMDGHQDIVAWTSGTISIYLGNGAGNWTFLQNIYITETQFSSMRVGDFNHDGLGDILYMAKTSTMNSRNKLNLYLSTPASPTLNIAPLHPQGAECFMPNSVQFLTWNSSVPVNNTATVTIEFSQFGTSGPFASIASNIPNSGNYQWTLPNIVSNNCLLRYTINDGNTNQIVTMSTPFGIGACNLTTDIENAGTTETNLTVYPNPLSENGYIQFIATNELNTTITITDVTGKIVNELKADNLREGENKIAFDASQLQAGVYFCTVNNKSVKFVVIK
jgi:hypothetical protein